MYVKYVSGKLLGKHTNNSAHSMARTIKLDFETSWKSKSLPPGTECVLWKWWECQSGMLSMDQPRDSYISFQSGQSCWVWDLNSKTKWDFGAKSTNFASNIQVFSYR